jgi:hypothetical protein
VTPQAMLLLRSLRVRMPGFTFVAKSEELTALPFLGGAAVLAALG